VPSFKSNVYNTRKSFLIQGYILQGYLLWQDEHQSNGSKILQEPERYVNIIKWLPKWSRILRSWWPLRWLWNSPPLWNVPLSCPESGHLISSRWILSTIASPKNSLPFSLFQPQFQLYVSLILHTPTITSLIWSPLVIPGEDYTLWTVSSFSVSTTLLVFLLCPILKCLQTVFFPEDEIPSFTPIQSRWNYSFLYFNLCIFIYLL